MEYKFRTLDQQPSKAMVELGVKSPHDVLAELVNTGLRISSTCYGVELTSPVLRRWAQTTPHRNIHSLVLLAVAETNRGTYPDMTTSELLWHLEEEREKRYQKWCDDFMTEVAKLEDEVSFIEYLNTVEEFAKFISDSTEVSTTAEILEYIEALFYAGCTPTEEWVLAVIDHERWGRHTWE